jgi:hypothetical protein
MANSHHRENEVPRASMALIKKAVKRVLERVVFITSKREENNLPRKEGHDAAVLFYSVVVLSEVIKAVCEDFLDLLMETTLL